MKLEKSLTVANMNQNLLNIKYAVRGPVLQRAEQIERDLEKGVPKPFTRVVRANLGDNIALGQKPITFIRQVLALVSHPALLESSDFPDDVKQRANELLDDCIQRCTGAYSPATGLRAVRRAVADHLTRRDGVPASPEDVILGSGASDLIKSVLSLFLQDVDGKPSSVMIPCPQYPLFSGLLSELGLRQADYFLDEARGWSLTLHELERSYRAAAVTTTVRAIVVINPGNPTGQVLSQENIEEVIKFAHKHNLFILADEVYQENIVSKPFVSFKKVSRSLGAACGGVQLASVLTASKGWAAECGARAAALELARVRPRVRAALLAARSLVQCAAVLGQCALYCIMKPPSPGEPSHRRFTRELTNIRRTLAERAAAAHRAFNSIPGYSCNVIDGAVFAFPRVTLPVRARAAAAACDVTPDTYYVIKLLEETGICVVPGSGFGQMAGTFHYRITILHTHEEFHYMMESIRRFHLDFLAVYS